MDTIAFKLTKDYIELIKLLKLTSIADTGGMAKMLVEEEQVRVDGCIEIRKRCKLRQGQRISLPDSDVEIVIE